MSIIQWVYDEFEGPVSGVALHDGKTVWFDRTSIGVPAMVSSTDVPVTATTATPQEPEYALSVLPDELLEQVRADHVAFCEATGAPVNHGDPIRMLQRPYVQRPDVTAIARDENGFIDAQVRSLISKTQVRRNFAPGSVKGELVTVVKQSHFTNYYVPRRVEIE